MTRQPTVRISDKLTKVNDSFTVNMYDNGFMIDIGGRNSEDDWCSAKVMFSDLDSLVDAIREITTIERD